MLKGEVDIHGFSGTGEVIRGSDLDVSSPGVPCVSPGRTEYKSVNLGEFWPLEVGAVCIEGVFLPSVLELKELPGHSLVGVMDLDVFGDVRGVSDLFGDISVGESIGLLI